jgi:hypothetical protein
MRTKNILLSLILIFTLFTFSTASAEGVGITPFRIEETVKPGQTTTNFITVTNNSDEAKVFYGEVKDFIPRGEGGEAILVPDNSEKEDSLRQWVNLPTSKISLGPGERREIPIIFDVPEDVGPGGYYGAILFGPNPPDEDPDGEGAYIYFSQKVGVLALLQVEGMVDEEAIVREFFTDKMFYFFTPFEVDLATRMENRGNVHIKPVGSIEITNMVGSQVATMQVNEMGGNILPGTVRRFENEWNDQFGFGRYEAMLSLSFGTPPSQGGMGIQTATTKTSFWIIPWKWVLGAILVLTLIGISLYLLFKRYKEKTVKEAVKKAGGDDSLLDKKDSSNLYFYLIVAIILILLLSIGGTIIFLLFA